MARVFIMRFQAIVCLFVHFICDGPSLFADHEDRCNCVSVLHFLLTRLYMKCAFEAFHEKGSRDTHS